MITVGERKTKWCYICLAQVFQNFAGKVAMRTFFFFQNVSYHCLMKELAQDLLSDMKLCSSHTFLSVIKIYNLCVLI